MLSSRQELLLGKVIDGYAHTGQPVGSKSLAADPEIVHGPSTVRHELAELERLGLLAAPHTSAGRIPTDAGHRYYVDRLLPDRRATAAVERRRFELALVRREVDEAMRTAAETLSQVTSLMAVVSAPPIRTATVRHVEVLALQPQVLMVVVITSTGGVTKRIFTLDRPIDSGLADWAASYCNEQLVGHGLGAHSLRRRLDDPTLPPTERAFIRILAPAFTDLEGETEHAVYVDGTARLISTHQVADVSALNALMELLERRVSVLGVLAAALERRDVVVRIGGENEQPALRSLSVVAAGYGLPQRHLGTVSLIGPTRMDYGFAIGSVREAAGQLSRFIEDVYEDA